MGLLEDGFEAKKQRQALARSGDAGAPPGAPRVPPGQVETKKFPVLHVGPVPSFERATWRLRIHGEVARPVALSWEEFGRLPRAESISDFHCVTRWSRLGNRWEGVPFAEVERLVAPRASARFVIFRCDGGYTTNVRIEDVRAPGVLLATHHDGAPLSPEHGGPLRVVVPHLYGWKSAKWVREVEFRPTDAPGTWETRGYHNIADPWLEQRFSGE